MNRYGYDLEDTHESMHAHRRERKYRGRKLAAAIHRNQLERSGRSRGSQASAELRLLRGE